MVNLDDEFAVLALKACEDKEMGTKITTEEDEKACLNHMRPFYNEAERMIQKVEKGAKIYRGLDMIKKHFDSFLSDITSQDKNRHVRPLGEYWSIEKEKARPFDEKPKNTIIVGRFPASIDHGKVKYLNMLYNGIEKEVRLFEGTQIEVVSVCRIENNEEKYHPVNRKAII